MGDREPSLPSDQVHTSEKQPKCNDKKNCDTGQDSHVQSDNVYDSNSEKHFKCNDSKNCDKSIEKPKERRALSKDCDNSGRKPCDKRTPYRADVDSHLDSSHSEKGISRRNITTAQPKKENRDRGNDTKDKPKSKGNGLKINKPKVTASQLKPQENRKRGPRKSRRRLKEHSLTLGYINCNGMRNNSKWHAATNEMNTQNMHLLLLTETHLRDEEAPDKNEEWEWMGLNRKEGEKNGGGLGIMHREDLRIHRKENCQEHMWVTLEPVPGGKPIAIGLVYMATNDCKNRTNDNIRACIVKDINRWRAEGVTNIILIGDFNAHIQESSDREDAEGVKLKDLAHRTNLTIVNNQEICKGKYTWQRGHQRTAIDFVLASQEVLPHIVRMEIDEQGNGAIESDHNLITVQINTNSRTTKEQGKPGNTKNNRNERPRWKLHSEDSLNEFAQAVELELNNKPNPDYDTFVNILLTEGQKACGKTEGGKKRRRKKPAWLTPQIKEAIHKRKIANKKHRQALRDNQQDGIQETWTNYKSEKKKAQGLIAKEMRKVDKKFMEELKKTNRKAAKKFWRYLKRNAKQTRAPAGLITDTGEIGTTEEEIKKVLNKAFDTHTTQRKEYTLKQRQPLPPFSITELQNILKHLPNGKAVGLDDIPNEFLKALKEKGQQALLELFNNILQGETPPQAWKTAHIRLIYKGKGKDKEDITSYRPIALLSNIYKCFATLLKNRMYCILESAGQLGDMQYGFRKNRGTSDGLFLFSQVIESALKQNKPLYAALLDVQTAYDTVNRHKLWEKLQATAIPGDYTNIMQEMYITTDSIYDWEGITSKTITSEVGLRQGCPLSALLFTLYIADLENKLQEGNNKGFKINKELSVCGIFYADDIILFAESPSELQNQLDSAAEFANQNCLHFSASKSEVIIFGDAEPGIIPYTIQGQQIEIKEEVTYLGIRFTSQSAHYLDKEVTHRMNKARRQKFLVLGQSRATYNRFMVARTLWKQVATPTLTYAQEALPFPQALWKECDKHQLDVGKYAVGANHIAPHITIEGEVGWSSFELRDARAKNCYAGHVLRHGRETTIRKVHDITRDQTTPTEWHNKLYAIRRKYDLGTNMTAHPDRVTWNKATTDTMNKHNEQKWKDKVLERPSLQRYQQKTKMHMETFYDNTLGSDLLYQARTGCLPTASRHHEIYGDNPACKLCNAPAEDIEHILVICPALERTRDALYCDTPTTEDISKMLGLSTPQQLVMVEKSKQLLEAWWSASGRPYPYWRKHY